MESPGRREELLRWLKAEGTLSYEQIQKRFKIAPMTARRDVAALDAQGKLVKVLRGAMKLNPEGLLVEGPLYLRQKKNLKAKQAIAQEALRIISANKTIYLDPGTTCIEFAKAIAQMQIPITVVTNSVLVAACFCERSTAKVIQIGGSLNTLNGCTTGAEAEVAAQHYFFDVGFFSTVGYVKDEGTYESSPDIYRVKLAFAPRCSETVLLVDHTKIGQRALSRVFDDRQFGRIITDRPVPGVKDPRIIVAR